MPRHKEAKKDAANGETRRGEVSNQRIVDIRMGEPTSGKALVFRKEGKTQGSETSKYLKEEKVKTITEVVASERVRAQTSRDAGVEGHYG